VPDEIRVPEFLLLHDELGVVHNKETRDDQRSVDCKQCERGYSKEEVSKREEEESRERSGEERAEEEHGPALSVQSRQGETDEDDGGGDEGSDNDRWVHSNNVVDEIR